MSDSGDSGIGCLAVIILFFMAWRGCSHADENEIKIDQLEQKIEQQNR